MTPPQAAGRLGANPAAATRAAERTGLTVLAAASWPASRPAGELPAIAGFIVSPFSPLAAALAEECLAGHLGDPPADQALGERTAIVLASATGDLATAAAVASAVDAGTRVPPLLFFQSNPNAVAGHVAARWGLAGPVVCTRPAGDPLADALASAELLIEDDAADAVLVIVANAYRDGTADGLALLLRDDRRRSEAPAQATSPGAAR